MYIMSCKQDNRSQRKVVVGVIDQFVIQVNVYRYFNDRLYAVKNHTDNTNFNKRNTFFYFHTIILCVTMIKTKRSYGLKYYRILSIELFSSVYYDLRSFRGNFTTRVIYETRVAAKPIFTRIPALHCNNYSNCLMKLIQ